MQSWSFQDGDLLGSEALSPGVLTLVEHRPETLEIICFLGSRIVRRARAGRVWSERSLLALAPGQRKPAQPAPRARAVRVRALAPGSLTEEEPGCGIFQKESKYCTL